MTFTIWEFKFGSWAHCQNIGRVRFGGSLRDHLVAKANLQTAEIFSYSNIMVIFSVSLATILPRIAD